MLWLRFGLILFSVHLVKYVVLQSTPVCSSVSVYRSTSRSTPRVRADPTYAFKSELVYILENVKNDSFEIEDLSKLVFASCVGYFDI